MNIALWIVQVLVGAFFIHHTTLMYRPPARPLSGFIAYGRWVLEPF